jgi:uncharacterized protein with HEPN domain
MHINDKILINHIYDEVHYLTSESLSIEIEDFLNNETLKRSFTRSIEIIGEASKKLSIDFKNTYSEINWKSLAGMRDKLIHHYFGVDYIIVWDVSKNKSIEIRDFIIANKLVETRLF